MVTEIPTLFPHRFHLATTVSVVHGVLTRNMAKLISAYHSRDAHETIREVPPHNHRLARVLSSGWPGCNLLEVKRWSRSV